MGLGRRALAMLPPRHGVSLYRVDQGCARFDRWRDQRIWVIDEYLDAGRRRADASR